MDQKATDQKRLDKLKALLRFSVAVHTNPVQVGVADLKWLIEKAEETLDTNLTKGAEDDR